MTMKNDVNMSAQQTSGLSRVLKHHCYKQISSLSINKHEYISTASSKSNFIF